MKTFDDGRAVLAEDITEAAVAAFIAGESLPFVVDFNQETAQKIFSGDIKSHLLAFLSVKADSHADDVAMLQSIAKENKVQGFPTDPAHGISQMGPLCSF